MIRLRWPIAIFLALIALWLGSLQAALAAGQLDVNARTGSVDLSPYRNPIAAERPKITVQPPGDQHSSDLEGQGPGPTFYWSIYSIHNSADSDQIFEVTIDQQSFPGSGLLNIRFPGSQVYQAVLTDPVRPLSPERVSNFDGISLNLKAGQTTTFAVQTANPNATVQLVQKSSLLRNVVATTFFNGLVLGIAAVVAFGILFIYAYRPNSPALAGWFFAVLATLFIVMEQGAWPTFVRPEQWSAMVHSLWAASLAACLITFTDLRKSNPSLFLVGVLAMGLLFANAAFAFVNPAKAASISRIAFAVFAIAGFILTFAWRSIRKTLVDSSLIFWTLLLGWTAFAGASALQFGKDVSLGPMLVGLLSVVLIALALQLLRFMFAQGLAAKPFITDQSRRSLALAGAGHAMWDYVARDGILDVSDDFPRLLGYKSSDWPGNARRLFKSILNPLDLKTYEHDVEGAPQRPGLVIEQELRLRDAEGQWRWFQLRARSIAGTEATAARTIGTLTEITKSKQAEQRIAVDSLLDPVTGLPNRNLFMDRLERELGKAVGLPLRVLIVEIDKFKSLNESLGQENGDRLLQVVGARILASLQSDETVARLSGGHFGILLVEVIGRREPAAFAAKLESELAKPILLPHYELNIDVSVGLSTSASRGVSAHELFQQASVALLGARSKPTDKVLTYDATMKDERAAQLSLEADLRRAVTGDEIEVHYQPISDLESGLVAGYEALARWRHPRLGLLPPQQFIDMAERIGLIGEIGEIVLAGAARQLGVWQRVARKGSTFFVAVNISVTHLMEEKFLQQVQTVVERESLAPSTLKVEITESVIMRQPERVMHVLQQLKSLGVGIACDDFGTGFSSLASLRDLPFDTVKLDRSFIAPSVLDERSSLIISSVTEMAHGLGMVVVAEGIERQDQIDLLSSLGCDLGQGFFIGAAQSAQTVTESLSQLPRYAPPPDVSEPPPQSTPVSIFGKREQPVPGTVPMAPRKAASEAVTAEDEPETLPSIFAMPTQPAKVEKPKLKRPVKKTAPKVKKKKR